MSARSTPIRAARHTEFCLRSQRHNRRIKIVDKQSGSGIGSFNSRSDAEQFKAEVQRYRVNRLLLWTTAIAIVAVALTEALAK